MTTYPNVKINVGLNILRRREDGFHDLETLFVPYFGMSDILEIEKCAGPASIELDGGSWDPKSDLSWKAYLMLREAYDLSPVNIHLVKRNPVGAGLGGGSADAAFTLRMLNEMFALELSDAELASYASRLGSDCAFFIYNRPMFGEGRGEILTPFDLDLSGYEIRVEIPDGVHVSTKEAYSGVIPRESVVDKGRGEDGKALKELRSLRSLRPLPPFPASSSAELVSGEPLPLPLSGGGQALQSLFILSSAVAPLREMLTLPVREWRGRVGNDFEPSVFALHPEIAALKERFYAEGAVYAAMSGSGSAVFGFFEK